MKKKILVADDDAAVHLLLKRLLTEEGFEIIDAYDGTEVTSLANQEKPDLIVLDQKMPFKDGLEAFVELRSLPSTKMTPVIVLTGSGCDEDMIRSLNLGADDYMRKPFKPVELLVRIKSIIRKTSLYLDANPLTRLPGNKVIENKITDLLQKKHPFSVLYADINRFKAYNDRYGFLLGDAVIQGTGELLVATASGPDDLVGHIGGDDFVVISRCSDAEPLCEQIIEVFNKLSPHFIPFDAQSSGPDFILDLAIGVVTTATRSFNSLDEISMIGAQTKKSAKQQSGSSYFIDPGNDLYDFSKEDISSHFSLAKAGS